MLDMMASRYHLLPSAVLSDADSLDFLVMDVAVSHERYVREREQARAAGHAPPAAPISVSNMQDMIKRVRNNDSSTG
jgi:hypothetical protein